MSLKIGVLVKYVPDTGSKIEIKDSRIDQTGLKFVINPYDEFAIEEAVKTKEKWQKEGQSVEIVGICLGPKAASKALRDAFAVGVDRGLHILDEEAKACDPKSISKALAEACKSESFNLIFAGKQAVDTDTHAVAVMVAEHLKMPHLAVVSKIDFEGTEMLTAERDVDGGLREIFKAKLPCLITANKGLNKMRLASLPGIRAAAKKEIKEVPLPNIEAGYRPMAWALPPERGQVKMIEGSPADQAKELIRVLREEAKVI